jgi:hypothetical protein
LATDSFFKFQIKEIDIENIAAQRSFIFLWCGSADGLDKGREVRVLILKIIIKVTCLINVYSIFIVFKKMGI